MKNITSNTYSSHLAFYQKNPDEVRKYLTQGGPNSHLLEALKENCTKDFLDIVEGICWDDMELLFELPKDHGLYGYASNLSVLGQSMREDGQSVKNMSSF